MKNQTPDFPKPITPVEEAASQPAAGGQAEEGVAEFVNLLAAVWQRRVIVLGVAALCLAASALYGFLATPSYRAVATIEVAPQEQNVTRIEDVNKPELSQLDALNTLVLKSVRGTVLSRVVKMNHLTQNPEFFVKDAPAAESAVAKRVADAVKGSLRRNTRLIDITATDPDPQMAQTLANGVATQFLRQEVEDQGAVTRFANVSLLEEAGRLKNELEQSERLLQTYREKNKTVSLEDRQNIVDLKLHALAQQLNDVRAELAQLRAQQEQAGALTNEVADLLELPAIKSDAVVASLLTQVAQQETLVNFYAIRYREKYPKMIEARQRLEELKLSVAEAARAARHTLDAVVAAARSKEQGLQSAVAEAEQESLALSRLAIDYNILQRDVDSNRNLYQAILQRLKETEVDKGIEKTSLQIVEPAGFPAKPFWPNRPMLLVAGLLGGLMLGVGLALLLAQFDNSIKSSDDAEQKLGVPVAGMLTFDPQLAKVENLLIMDQPGSILAEGFRSLRASIAMYARSAERQVVLFTSPGAGEGKSLSASNYGLALARQELRTVIIDLDLRCPMIGKTFGLQDGLPGVSDFLLGRARLENIIHPSGFARLDVIPAGAAVPNPSEQLASQWLARLLQEARGRYDVVVLDTAPLNPVSDTLAFVHQADVVLLVVCGRHTPIQAARRAITTLRRSGKPASGLILNRMSAEQAYYKDDYAYIQENKAAAATVA